MGSDKVCCNGAPLQIERAVILNLDYLVNNCGVEFVLVDNHFSGIVVLISVQDLVNCTVLAPVTILDRLVGHSIDFDRGRIIAWLTRNCVVDANLLLELSLSRDNLDREILQIQSATNPDTG